MFLQQTSTTICSLPGLNSSVQIPHVLTFSKSEGVSLAILVVASIVRDATFSLTVWISESIFLSGELSPDALDKVPALLVVLKHIVEWLNCFEVFCDCVVKKKFFSLGERKSRLNRFVETRFHCACARVGLTCTKMRRTSPRGEGG